MWCACFMPILFFIEACRPVQIINKLSTIRPSEWATVGIWDHTLTFWCFGNTGVHLRKYRCTWECPRIGFLPVFVSRQRWGLSVDMAKLLHAASAATAIQCFNIFAKSAWAHSRTRPLRELGVKNREWRNARQLARDQRSHNIRSEKARYTPAIFDLI